MEEQDLIPANDFCVHHSIELSFIQSLHEYGMIETVTVKETMFLPAAQLERLEKIVTLHYDLGVNLEGIETIGHLLERIKGLQSQISTLTNRLRET